MNDNTELSTINRQTMSSREIAEITEKRHDHVMVDCRKLLDFYIQTYSPEKSGELVKSDTYTDSTGRKLPCYLLSRDASIDLVTGYSLPHRHAINQRWMELEAAAATPKMPTHAEALEGWARTLREKEAIEADNARLEADNVLMRPKADMADSIAKSSSEVTVTEASKLFGKPAAEIRRFMVANRWTSKDGKRTVAWAQKAGLVGFRMDYIPQLGREVPVVTIRGKGLAVLHESLRTGDLCASYEDRVSLMPPGNA